MTAEEARATVKEFSKFDTWLMEEVQKKIEQSARAGHYSTVHSLTTWQREIAEGVVEKLKAMGYQAEVQKTYHNPMDELWVSWYEYEGENYN